MYIAAGDKLATRTYRTLNPNCCGSGQCALFVMRRLFEGGDNKTQSLTARGRLFEGGYYLRAASDRGNTVPLKHTIQHR